MEVIRGDTRGLGCSSHGDNHSHPFPPFPACQPQCKTGTRIRSSQHRGAMGTQKMYRAYAGVKGVPLRIA